MATEKENTDSQNLFRLLPSVDEFLKLPQVVKFAETRSHSSLVNAVRVVLDKWRQGISEGKIHSVDTDAMVDDLSKLLHELDLRSLRRVVNGTGIIVHTNLGRSLLPPSLEQQLKEVAFHYNTLEYDVEEGERGSRYVHVEGLLRELLGVEGALVVNNNAAAVLLALNTLAKGKEVIVSRGELIEIGGSFRIPDVMTQSGAILKEVGTTNRTRVEDYTGAIGENTGLLFKAHTSNYRIIGFTQEVDVGTLARIGKSHNVPTMMDLGSGVMVDLALQGIDHEPTVQEVVNAGVDIVTFSGDKLLGGPQAGIIVGKKAFIDAMKKNPLTRALRVDKLCLTMLEGTLRIYRDGNPMEMIPTLHMMAMPMEQLEERANRLNDMLSTIKDVNCCVVQVNSAPGGGSLPGQQLPSFGVSVKVGSMSEVELERRLRQRDIPIISRIVENKVILDMRTLLDEDFQVIFDALQDIVSCV